MATFLSYESALRNLRENVKGVPVDTLYSWLAEHAVEAERGCVRGHHTIARYHVECCYIISGALHKAYSRKLPYS